MFFIYSVCFSQAELDWNFNTSNISNEVIFPQESVYEAFSGQENLPIGSLIGVFYLDENDEYKCAGYSSFAGDDTNVTVYADNPETSELDGLLNGAQFYYFLRIQEGGGYSDYIALDTDVEYYPDFPIPGFPSFSNDTFDANFVQPMDLSLKIDVVDDISQRDFNENYLKAQKPLLIKGGVIRKSPAYKKWSMEYLKEKFDDVVVDLIDSSKEGESNTAYKGGDVKMKFRD